MRASDFDIFSTGQIEASIHSKTSAVGDGRSADAAPKLIPSRLASGVDDGSPLLAISFSVGSLAPSEHSMVIEAISEVPCVTSSSSVLCFPAEESIISKIFGASLVAVKTFSGVATGAAIVAEKS